MSISIFLQFSKFCRLITFYSSLGWFYNHVLSLTSGKTEYSLRLQMNEHNNEFFICTLLLITIIATQRGTKQSCCNETYQNHVTVAAWYTRRTAGLKWFAKDLELLKAVSNAPLSNTHKWTYSHRAFLSTLGWFRTVLGYGAMNSLRFSVFIVLFWV